MVISREKEETVIYSLWYIELNKRCNVRDVK